MRRRHWLRDCHKRWRLIRWPYPTRTIIFAVISPFCSRGGGGEVTLFLGWGGAFVLSLMNYILIFIHFSDYPLADECDNDDSQHSADWATHDQRSVVLYFVCRDNWCTNLAWYLGIVIVCVHAIWGSYDSRRSGGGRTQKRSKIVIGLISITILSVVKGRAVGSFSCIINFIIWLAFKRLFIICKDCLLWCWLSGSNTYGGRWRWELIILRRLLLHSLRRWWRPRLHRLRLLL
jgi:hypothetical protein